MTAFRRQLMIKAKVVPTIPNYFCIVPLVDGVTVRITKTGTSNMTVPELQYSTNGVTWTNYTIGNTITLNNGQKLYWKGNNLQFSTTTSTFYQFNISGDCNIKGNTMSLLYDDDFEDKTAFPNNRSYIFNGLFRECDIVDASELLLPATVITSYCYYYMFYYCTKLISAPQLPATTSAQRCYAYMFYNCTSLTVPPSDLPAKTLASYCYYNMFYNCTSLTTAPTIEATTLATYCCNNMFVRCQFTTAPVLHALTLKNYCYTSMFRYCDKLNYVKAMFTTAPGSTYTSSWMQGVSSSGTYVMNKNATYSSRGISAIPTNWTIQKV